MGLSELSVQSLQKKYIDKEISAVDCVKDVFQTIRDKDPHLKAFLTLNEAAALKEAERIDQKRAKGQSLGKLAGVPIALKDNLMTIGMPTTCSSKILEGYMAPYNATVVEKLKAEDAIIIGKTNLDEFAMGSSTENSAFGASRNPWDITRAPGGSSGGSAVAVAGDEVVLGLGSDTGGSIRQPASFCGVVGMKPTYGRVSRYGLVAFASSLDQIGPFSKNVRDAALLLEVISGKDPMDATSVDKEPPLYTNAIEKGVKGVKIGVPKEYFIEGVDPEVKKSIEDTIDVYEKLGAHMSEITLPHTEYCIAVYYIIATAEASSNLARYDGVEYGYRASGKLGLKDMYKETRGQGFGPEVKRRILLGTYALSSGYYDAYYLKAQKARTLIKQDFDKAFEAVDLVLTPTSPTTAFRLGEKTDDPLNMYLSDVFTISANLAGLPGISLPCGFDKSGLPIGLQLLGRAFEESAVLEAAHAYEQATDHHKQKPKFETESSA